MRYFASFLAAILSLFITTGCKEAPAPLRVGINPWPGYQPIKLAESLGYFEEEGIEVELIDFMSNGEVNRSYSRGFLDIATSTSSDLISLRENFSVAPIGFFACDYSNGADVIISQQSIPDFAALKGKKIGADIGALDMVHLLTALEKNQILLSGIHIVPMQQSDMLEAMQMGEVDAVVTYPPISNSLLKSDPSRHIVFDSSMIPGTIVDILIAEQLTITERSDDLAAFIRALARAVEYAQMQPQVANRMMGESLGISAEEMSENLAGLKLLKMSEQAELFTENSPLIRSILKSIQVLNVAEGKYSPNDMLSAQIIELAQ